MQNHKTCGWGCECWRVVGYLLWTAGVVSLLYAWIAGGRGEILGRDPEFWFFTGLIFSVLAVPLRMNTGEYNCGCTSCMTGKGK